MGALLDDDDDDDDTRQEFLKGTVTAYGTEYWLASRWQNKQFAGSITVPY